MFDRAGIAYHPVDPDSVAYQHEARGGKTRATPSARTRVVTIQQGFVGGEFSGGCTEVFEAWRDGLLQDLLRRNDGAVRELEREPYTFSQAGRARSGSAVASGAAVGAAPEALGKNYNSTRQMCRPVAQKHWYPCEFGSRGLNYAVGTKHAYVCGRRVAGQDRPGPHRNIRQK